MLRPCLAAATCALAMSAPAFGQEVQTDALERPLNTCRAQADDAERLACYDRTLDDIFGVDAELQAKREKTRKDRFGLPTDGSGLQMTELTAIVSEVDEDLRTRAVTFALENGQVWRLGSTGGLRARIKRGMEVVISESGTGGYRLRVEGKPGFRGVDRVR